MAGLVKSTLSLVGFMRLISLSILVLGLSSAYGQSSDDVPASQTSRTYHFAALSTAADATRIAREAAKAILSKEEWQAEVDKMKHRFANAKSDGDADMGQFLNDHLLGIALAARGGDIPKLRDGLVFVAMYKEFDQPLPDALTNFIKLNLDSINHLVSEFTWDKAQAYVRNKQWRAGTEIHQSVVRKN